MNHDWFHGQTAMCEKSNSHNTLNITYNERKSFIDNLMAEFKTRPEYTVGPYLVGSRAYDNAYPQYRASTVESDHDYIIPIESDHIVRLMVKKHAMNPHDICEKIRHIDNCIQSDYNNGYKFYVKNSNGLGGYDIINIIPVIHVEWNAWYNATKTLISWAGQDELVRRGLVERNVRIALLEQQKASFKSAIAYGSVINNLTAKC